MEIYIEKSKRIMVIKFIFLKKLKYVTCFHYFEFKEAGNIGHIFDLNNK